MTVDGGFDVEPDSTLTATDRAFILRHLDEAIKIVHLQEADDSHLSQSPAQVRRDFVGLDAVA